MKNTKHRILVITTRLPYPLIGGDRIRSFTVCSILSRHYNVDLLVLSESSVKPEYLQIFSEMGIRVVLFEFPSRQYIFRALRGIALGQPMQVLYYYSRKIQNWIDEHLSDYDLAYCIHVRSTEYLKKKSIPKIVDLVDAISLNYERAKPHVSGMWRWIYLYEHTRLRDYEIKMTNEFDQAIVVSSVDKDFLVNHGASKDRIAVVPIAVNNNFIKNYTLLESKDRVTFVGKMNTVANADAAEYFATMIFPEIRKKASNTEFFVVGADPTPRVNQLSKLDGVTVTGKVEDHIAYIRQSKVIVAPMRFGAGMQNKILEAMALGKPVVTTTIGAEGIEAVDGVHFLIADSADDCSRLVLRLLDDTQLCRAIGNAAHKLIQEKYTWDVVGQSLLKLIQHSLNETK